MKGRFIYSGHSAHVYCGRAALVCTDAAVWSKSVTQPRLWWLTPMDGRSGHYATVDDFGFLVQVPA